MHIGQKTCCAISGSSLGGNLAVSTGYCISQCRSQTPRFLLIILYLDSASTPLPYSQSLLLDPTVSMPSEGEHSVVFLPHYLKAFKNRGIDSSNNKQPTRTNARVFLLLPTSSSRSFHENRLLPTERCANQHIHAFWRHRTLGQGRMGRSCRQWQIYQFRTKMGAKSPASYQGNKYHGCHTHRWSMFVLGCSFKGICEPSIGESSRPAIPGGTLTCLHLV